MGKLIHCNPNKGKSHHDVNNCDPIHAECQKGNNCEQTQVKSRSEAINLDSNKGIKSTARDLNTDQSQGSQCASKHGVYENLDDLNLTVTVDTKKTKNDEVLDSDKKIDDPYHMLFF
ncbi:unnamed protein product [Pieris macdunnoughi]|uniref:Uncharacterized protein n=1 Tax=Pieris macdunnoughi TaxID=345717 RepID=A0A821KWV3_9NEOP|nr:unnamed protein product [Pieris macdunnoughi]